MSTGRRKTFSSIYSPPGFAIIDESIFRACWPIDERNIEFIYHLELSEIMNFSSRAMDPPLAAFAEACGITVHNIAASPSQTAEVLSSSSYELSGWLKHSLEQLLSVGNSSVLLLGDMESTLDLLLIAALRRLQKWSFTCTITEFRSLAGRNIFDYEQVIEAFDPSIVELPRPLPLHISSYFDVRQEEVNFHASLAAGKSLSSEDAAKMNFLARMFSPDANVVITENAKYDPTLRSVLINGLDFCYVLKLLFLNIYYFSA
jgi:hypothetical protein